MKAAARDLHNDQRGAVMMIGLGMSCFLIGSLWFLIGIGDAIIFRDVMQEATDSAAFTSATLHAKGMNFISACNLLMLVAIVVYIVLGILHDILLAICIVGALFSFGTACIPWVRYRPIYTNYAKGMKIFCDIVHYLEIGAAYGYPILATYKGWSVGKDYGSFKPANRKLTIIPFSTSVIPGQLVEGPLSSAIAKFSEKGANGQPTRDFQRNRKNGVKKGLPVEGQAYKKMCEKIGKMGIDALISLTGKSAGGNVMSMVKGWIGKAIQFRYCNSLGTDEATEAIDKLKEGVGKGNDKIDEENKKRADDNSKLPADGSGGKPQDKIDNVDIGKGNGSGGGGFNIGKIEIGSHGGSIDPGFDQWWGKEGQLVVWGPAGNGTGWQFIWAVNFKPEFKDESEHKVGIAARKFGVEQTAKDQMYLSEAEFYYDCPSKWVEEECNAEEPVDANASYAIKWRARLRRLQFPPLGSMLTSFAGSFLTNMKGYSGFKDALPGKINEMLGGGLLSSTGIETVIEFWINKAELAIKGWVNDNIGGGIDKILEVDGIYH